VVGPNYETEAVCVECLGTICLLVFCYYWIFLIILTKDFQKYTVQ
jgi:hypothetical protein